MITLPRHLRVFALAKPADLRKGFEGLSALVRLELGRNPLSGDFFLFVNRSRHRAKVLLWDGTGLCIFAKRLEKGRFAAPWREPGRHELSLTASELQLFLEGNRLVGKIKLSPDEIAEKDLAIALPR